MTSGTPSQNVDLAGLSFPRRIGFRLAVDYLERHSLLGKLAKWEAYEDSEFKHKLKGNFDHEDLIDSYGWVRYLCVDIFPNEKTYIKCSIKNSDTDMLIKTFYFVFTKTHVTTLDGKFYIKDPLLKTKIVKDGVLTELIRVKKDGKIVLVKGRTTYDKNVIDYEAEELVSKKAPAIIGTITKYTERQKGIFTITPPHLMKYAKLILILIRQLVDLNFDQSYTGKPDQKPHGNLI